MKDLSRRGVLSTGFGAIVGGFSGFASLKALEASIGVGTYHVQKDNPEHKDKTPQEFRDEISAREPSWMSKTFIITGAAIGAITHKEIANLANAEDYVGKKPDLSRRKFFKVAVGSLIGGTVGCALHSAKNNADAAKKEKLPEYQGMSRQDIIAQADKGLPLSLDVALGAALGASVTAGLLGNGENRIAEKNAATPVAAAPATPEA